MMYCTLMQKAIYFGCKSTATHPEAKCTQTQDHLVLAQAHMSCFITCILQMYDFQNWCSESQILKQYNKAKVL